MEFKVHGIFARASSELKSAKAMKPALHSSTDVREISRRRIKSAMATGSKDSPLIKKTSHKSPFCQIPLLFALIVLILTLLTILLHLLLPQKTPLFF